MGEREQVSCQDCQQAGWAGTTTEHTGAALMWSNDGRVHITAFLFQNLKGQIIDVFIYFIFIVCCL